MQALYTLKEAQEAWRACCCKTTESAYTALVVLAQQLWEAMQGRARLDCTQGMMLLCGSGFKAALGCAVALHAAESGVAVQCVYVGSKPALPEALEPAWEALCATSRPVRLLPFAEDVQSDAGLWVDALCDADALPTVEPYTQAASWVQRAWHAAASPAGDAPFRLALGAPSGLDVDTGMLQGVVIKADLTLVWDGAKRGFYTGSGKTYVGALQFIESAVHACLLATDVCVMDRAPAVLPPRACDAHKGDFGRILVVGGDYGMGGAVRMAAEAALRSGAGRVKVATRPEHVAVVSAQRPEIMCAQIREAQAIDAMVEEATVVVLGPGLGQCSWSQALYDRLIAAPRPKVLDADALNLLAQQPIKRDDWILTPHAGEAARLLGVQPGDVQANRFDAVRDLVARYGGVVVLKGAGTLVLSSEDPTMLLCPYGNPGMATAGMGDMLSGVIGALLGQGLGLREAAALGVYLHACSGDDAAQSIGERGILATDLLAYLPEHLNRVACVEEG